MIVSVLLPTRSNAYNCSVAIDSYIMHSSSKNELEILVGVDEDDQSKTFLFEKYKHDARVRFLTFKRIGYWNNHIIMNYLAHKSRGHILWMGNCKSMVLSGSWDTALNKYEGKMLVGSHITEWYDHENASPAHRYWRRSCMLFPIISRVYLDVVGEFSNFCRNDSWIAGVLGHLNDYGEDGANMLNSIHPVINEIVICHDRSKTPKYTCARSEKEWCIPIDEIPEEYKKYGHIFYGKCVFSDGLTAFDRADYLRKQSAQKIYNFLKSNPDCIPER